MKCYLLALALGFLGVGVSRNVAMLLSGGG